MSEYEPDYESAVYTCPKCGGIAKIRPDYNIAVICEKCGETKIALSFKTNGDMATIVDGTDEYYEVDPSVRNALAHLEDMKKGGDSVAIAVAMTDLALAYNQSGREVKAENIAKDALQLIREAYLADGKLCEKYCDQLSLCAAYASARGDFETAKSLFDEGLKDLVGVQDINVASIMVKRGVLWSKKDSEAAEKHLLNALKIADACDSSTYPDPFIRVIAYETLRGIYMNKGQKDVADKYVQEALSERKKLSASPDTPLYRVIELIDLLGYCAEDADKNGDVMKAEAFLDQAVTYAEKSGKPEASAYAIMNRVRFDQTKNRDFKPDFAEKMTFVIDTLAACSGKDKRLKDTLAQAHMFRSMVCDAEDYDGMLKDIGSSYDLLLELAYAGEVNELFLMSAAHSYLVLLNMKDPEKAKAVREELIEIGISQKELDRASRSSIGNLHGRRTKVETSAVPLKPMPGRRLKRQIRKKDKIE